MPDSGLKSTAAHKPPSGSRVPRSVITAILGLALGSIPDLAAATMRIGAGGGVFRPVLGVATLALLLGLAFRRQPTVWTCARVYGTAAVVLGVLAFLSRFHWHAGANVVFSSV